MKRTAKVFVFVALVIVVFWTALTFYVQAEGPAATVEFNKTGSRHALVLYDPDPIYNLDEQVAKSFAEGLAGADWRVTVQTVAARPMPEVELYVFVANTYNWAPDDAVLGAIEKIALEERATIAITLGSGSTDRAQRLLEEAVTSRGGRLLESKVFWLMRPNDETRMKESNIDVAVDQAFWLGQSTSMSK